MRTRWVSTATDPKLKPLFGNVLLNTMSFGSSPEVCKPCLHKIDYIVNTVKFSMICVYVSLHQIIIWNTCENVCMVTILTREHPSVARSLRDYNIWKIWISYTARVRQDNLFPSFCDGGRTKPKLNGGRTEPKLNILLGVGGGEQKKEYSIFYKVVDTIWFSHKPRG